VYNATLDVPGGFAGCLRRFSAFPAVEGSSVESPVGFPVGSPVAMTRVASVKPLPFIKFTNGTVIVVCMNLVTADVESGILPAAGPLEWISTIGRAWLSVIIVAGRIWLSVCMIKTVDCTGTDLRCVVLQTTAEEVLFNHEDNLSLSVLTAASVMPEEYTGEKSEVGGTEIVKISRLPVALSKVASMAKIGLTEIDP